MISIIVPFYEMKEHEYFLSQCLESIEIQSYKDYEILVIRDGSAAENINKGIRQAKGDIIKVLCMDDYFTHEDSLKEIVQLFDQKTMWAITGCSNNLHPVYTGDLHLGNNKLGGLSCVAFRKETYEFFDEDLVWLLDADFYKRLYTLFGEPKILDGDNVTIEEGDHQATRLIDPFIKVEEVFRLRQKYV